MVIIDVSHQVLVNIVPTEVLLYYKTKILF